MRKWLHKPITEARLAGHLAHHSVKDWLLDGCEREDANTIREAIERIPTRRLVRRLARMLAKDD